MVHLEAEIRLVVETLGGWVENGVVEFGVVNGY